MSALTQDDIDMLGCFDRQAAEEKRAVLDAMWKLCECGRRPKFYCSGAPHHTDNPYAVSTQTRLSMINDHFRRGDDYDD